MTGVRLTALVLLAITAAALLEQSSTRGQASISVEGWVLPFDTRDSGSYGMLISNAPGIPGHLVSNGTALDIDYAPDTGSSVPARSPADGVVLDIFLRDPADEGSNGGFGNILRIDHGGIASFFAHLKDGSITVGVGDRVSQGQIVAEIGDTGVGGAHLHFGAQAGAVAGDRRSGTDLPLTEIPGNWFYSCYSPPPNFSFTCPNIWSGVAEYPVRWDEPSWTATPAGSAGYSGLAVRHLSNELSPTGHPTMYFIPGDEFATSGVLALGANPGTESDLLFHTARCVGCDGNWTELWPSTSEPVAAIAFPFQAAPVEHFLLHVDSSRGWSGLNFAFVTLAWQRVDGAPHLAFSAGQGDAHGALEFATAGKTFYQVNEVDSVTGQQRTFYSGSATSIGVGNFGSADGEPVDTADCYTVWAWDPVGGWTSNSHFICLPG